MTLIVGGAVIVTLLVTLLVTIDARARDARARERSLLELVREERKAHGETLDRVMHATGRPWNAPPAPVRLDELEETYDPMDGIVEDPAPGASYGLPWPDELEGELQAANGRAHTGLFDTREVDPL